MIGVCLVVTSEYWRKEGVTRQGSRSRSHALHPRPHRPTPSQTHALTDSRPHRLTPSQTHALTDSRPHRLTPSQIHTLTDTHP
ncbi:hypothetical protein Pmani_025574 [Petrolisthes manimaculis]|uniref:Uncharacterized protein n=1 Tax=Petrolisthes manimaculis TaxID=1843537 RepID=A0AAE1P7I4_9EUCA|nr:hypothetical protein Pmani_025574 [Petrolisthes manimaculis]